MDYFAGRIAVVTNGGCGIGRTPYSFQGRRNYPEQRK